MSEHMIEQMIRTMAAKGLRITEQRRTLARLFAEAPEYLTVKEVYEGLTHKHSGLSLDTVYRNLRILEDLGVLEQFHFESGSKFRIGCFIHEHEHHHHFICMSCDRIPFEYCPMTITAELPDSFRVIKHKFEIYGYCQFCLEQNGDMTPSSSPQRDLTSSAS